MLLLADLHKYVIDVDAERDVGLHERQHGRRRHDAGRPPRQHVCVAGECRGHGTYTDRQEAIDNKLVAFVDGDVTLNLGTGDTFTVMYTKTTLAIPAVEFYYFY